MSLDEHIEGEALRELRDLLRPAMGDETDLAIEGLVRYMAIVIRIYESIEEDPERLARLRALTSEVEDPTMTTERSFTNQYSKP
jgi:hypothetical protein